MSETEPAASNIEEARTIETEITERENEASTEEVRARAMEESRKYFEQQEKNVRSWLVSAECDDVLAALVDIAKTDRAMSLEELTHELGLPPEMEKWLPVMLEAVKQCQPISEIMPAVKYIQQAILEQANPSSQLAEAMSQFDASSSWYHTTDEGKKRLQQLSS